MWSGEEGYAYPPNIQSLHRTVSMVSLAARYSLGVQADVKDNVHFVDEQTIVFPAGANVVFLNTETKEQKFVPIAEKAVNITALALSPNKKYVAIAEAFPSPEPPQVTILDVQTLKKRKILSAAAAEMQCDAFISLSFSADSKCLLTHGNAPDWPLAHWHWERARVNNVYNAASNNQAPTIYGCSFNPHDASVMCVTGDSVCRFLRWADQVLKPLPSNIGKREAQAYLCHAWVSDDRVIVATDTGDLHLLESGELKASISTAPADGMSINSIVAYSKGFVCGSDGGVVHVFEKAEEKEYYRRVKSFRIEGHAVKILNMAVSPSEEQLVCTLGDSQVYVLTLSNVDILKPDEMNFDPLPNEFHDLVVTGLDTCLRKPLFATCGLDKSIRIWNYAEREVEISKTFTEEVYSISFHPSGLHILAGFADKLRLMNLLMDDIRSYREFPVKGCRECRFSHGGQLFAAVSGNTIQLYVTYTCEALGNLRAHSSKVKSVAWSADDTRIISTGTDGAVYEWALKDMKRHSEYVQKSCTFSCAVCTPDVRSIIAVGSDSKLKEIVDGTLSKEFDSDVTLTQLELSYSGRILFAGTAAGTIRLYRVPLTGDYVEIKAHRGPVTRLSVTFDDGTLFSTAEDSVVYIFDVRDKEGRLARREKDTVTFADEILVTRSDLEEKTQSMQELKTKVEELTMQNEYQLRLKDLNFTEKMKEVTDSYQAEVEEARKSYEALLSSRNEMEMEYEERLKSLENKHAQHILALESQYQQKIITEVERYQQLETAKQAEREKWEEKLSTTISQHESNMRELTEEYEIKLSDEMSLLEAERSEKEGVVEEFDETRRQIEEDVDREIEEYKEKYEAKLLAEKDTSLRLKGENGIMRRKFTALQKDIEDQKDEINALFQSKKALHEHIASLEKDVAGLKKEIRERDETIGDKEKRIYDLKKKNQELEKFKFVLDYKIKELKKQIEPREVEIMQTKEQIKLMDQELERYHSNNGALELTISDLKLKIDGMHREIVTLRSQISGANARVNAICNELHSTAQCIQDPHALKDAVKNMYHKYVTEVTSSQVVENNVAAEYSRQREYLEKSVESLKKKLTKNQELHRSDNARMMQENVALIKEINELRREVKGFRDGNQDKARGGTRAQPNNLNEAIEELNQQKRQVAKLTEKLLELDPSSLSAAKSKEQLPPYDLSTATIA